MSSATQHPVAPDAAEVIVDAALLAALFEITPEALKVAMRAGTITSLCESGIDEHAGLYRLSFFSPHRRVRLSLSTAGEVLSRSVVDYDTAPLPAAMRRPGG